MTVSRWDVTLAVTIGRVELWPRVGGRSLFWYDDPDPAMPPVLEHYRISSGIRSIPS